VLVSHADSFIPSTYWIWGWDGLRENLDAVAKTNICPLLFLSFCYRVVTVPIELSQPNSLDNYLFKLGIVSPYHSATVSHAVYPSWGWASPSGLMSKSHYVMSLILCLNFSQFCRHGTCPLVRRWLASLSPCQCSYLPVCMISSLMCTVYAEHVYTTKLHGYIKPQFPHLTFIGPCIVTYFYSKTN